MVIALIIIWRFMIGSRHKVWVQQREYEVYSPLWYGYKYKIIFHYTRLLTPFPLSMSTQFPVEWVKVQVFACTHEYLIFHYTRLSTYPSPSMSTKAWVCSLQFPMVWVQVQDCKYTRECLIFPYTRLLKHTPPPSTSTQFLVVWVQVQD